jgi:NAD(P)-dependent dehydrogenase (short-subunit alcohol dehydrogenase family)
MDLQLKGKLALVSGSTAGIGLAIATTLAREGARVILNGRAQASVDEVVAKVRSTTGGDVQGFAGDLSKAAIANDLARQHPGVEVLVNNLGIFEPKTFEEISDEDWIRFFDVNVVSGVRLARLYLPAMKRSNWGRIIFISSESAVQSPPEMIHYGTTKTAQLAVSRGLAEAVAGTGITVNAFLVGPTKSRGVDEFVDTKGRRKVVRAVREGVLRKESSNLAHQAFRLARGGRLFRGLHRQSAGVHHHRRGSTG